mmetsp:Transcript_19128/g.34830  ORF Transcript_19128/g.34830 Transcript_19128/m.34830 type:complete len:567 (+) Transcript_19128:261-1961(+)
MAGWHISLYCEQGEIYAKLEMADSLLYNRVKVFGVNDLSPYQSLRVIKQFDDYCVIGGRLRGGGCVSSSECCGSKDKETPTPNLCIDPENQVKAGKFAAEIEENLSKGQFDNLPLAELENIPVSTVESPLSIAINLINALRNDVAWSNNYRYQLRNTIARLARKYFVSFAIARTNPVLFETSIVSIKDKISQILDIAAAQDRLIALNTGVEVEFKVMNMLAETLKSNKKWLKVIKENAGALVECYNSKSPAPIVEPVANLFAKLRAHLSKDALVERSLLIDRLYSETDEEAIRLLKDIIAESCDSNSWESCYLALSFLEWGVHRDLFKIEQLQRLGPNFETLLTKNMPKANKKLLTVLMKLKELGLFGDLLKKVRSKVDKEELNFYDNLIPYFMKPECKLKQLTNLDPSSRLDCIGRGQELTEVSDVLKREHSVSIVGIPGIGKTTLSLKVAKECLRKDKFDVVWVCSAKSPSTLAASLKTLSDSLGVYSTPKEEYRILLKALSTCKVLLVFDDASLKHSDIYERFRRNPNHYSIFNSTDSNFNHPYSLKGWTEEVAISFMREAAY